MLTIGSLFSGIGGLEKGLEDAGLGPVLWQCEIDPFCRAVLAKHWPDVTRFEDVTAVRNWPHADVICAGFPCQNVSSASAGKAPGLSGPQSGLWYTACAVIRDVRPSAVVIENVASGANKWLRIVRHGLHMLGYRTEAMGIDARTVGAPHTRARIFVAGYAHKNNEPARAKHAKVAKLPRTTGHLRNRWAAPPGIRRMDDGVPEGVHRLRALGNAVVPACAEVVGRILMDRIGKQ